MRVRTGRRPPSAARVDRALARYVRRTVYPYSAHYRETLDRLGLGATGVSGRRDLPRLPPTNLRLLDDPGALVLRPDLDSIRHLGSRWLATRAMAAGVLGTRRRFNRDVLEPRFKPVHWVVSGGTPLGYSLTDLLRLAELGRGWLDLAGVGRHDVLVNLLAPDESVAYWQLVGGTRRARVSALHHGPSLPPLELARLAPSVLAGSTESLIQVLSGVRREGRTLATSLRTVIAVDDGAERARPELGRLAAPATVVEAWCAPGARVVWSECREAAEQGGAPGLHTWEGTEVVESSEWGLLWTGIGWRGSALLRVQTGARASTADGPCPYCGRSGQRVIPAAPGWLLDGDADVVAWQLEHRPADRGPIVFVALRPGADVEAVLRRIDAGIAAAQYVVVSPGEIERRLDVAGSRAGLGPALAPSLGPTLNPSLGPTLNPSLGSSLGSSLGVV